MLKKGADLNLFEQNNITAEDRAWWVKRIEKQQEAEKQAYNRGKSGGPSSAPH